MKVVFGICFPRHPCSFQRPNHPFQIPKPPFQIQFMPVFFVCFSLIFATYMVDYLIFKLIIWQFQLKFVSLPQIT